MSQPPVNEIELSAFVDGEVLPERRPFVESYLLAHPEAAARVETWRRQNEIIRAALGSPLSDPAPLARAREHTPCIVRTDSVAQKVVALAEPATCADGAPLRSPRDRSRTMAAATAGSFVAGAFSALLAVAVAGLLPQMLSRQRSGAGSQPIEVTAVSDFAPVLAGRAIEAHQTYANEPRETSITAEILHDRLSLRMGMSIPVPNLEAQGWQPKFGRIAPADIGRAAFIVYEDPRGERIGFLVTRVPGDDGLRFAQGRGASVALWTSAGVGYAVSGVMERQRLLSIAETVRTALTKSH